ncbi:hypothetical protein CO165_02865 [Candidatus Roizmanbacteria bacterium CG_4_9_14_3_um_filter_33_18]|uniref:Uncharacterized protein n=1 Tax=Candidatus Roizmanbacteria bacterium CG_4_9_14_3_um_filter_33_18 TaxID=1974841 RepID=A0A2M7XXW7_9BACT|nr:MAG: hypothetical protein CO165_02865 [Candidatus Roizmanbacteria bacterium CG_4_9_14_3_um_filter_33_18]
MFFIILAIFLIGELFFYIKNSLELEEFNNPNYLFRLKYPKIWYLKILDDRLTVQIKNTSKDTQVINNDNDEQEISSYTEFYINCNQLHKSDDSSSAKNYILKKEQDFIESEKQRCLYKKPCLPLIPGFTQNYVDEVKGIFTQSGISAVQVNFFHYSPDYGLSKALLTKKEYVLIANHKTTCTIDIVYPNTSSEQQIKSINFLNKIFNNLIIN